ncbi:MAG TPA: 30S ribosomal protein S11 [Patescibacteria group bacterium]|nr:MAG: 30S ribosomal protein S11 [Parcubacteria group bacterium GW2011_GWA2_46_39]HLD86327.1 30S ribosomal protein S11 [Patescibacteria group bacterium]
MIEDVKPTAVPTSQPAAETTPTAGAARARRGKKKRLVIRGQAHILATYNNTVVTLADQTGNVLVTCSAGQVGFKGPKKSTPYAAGIVVRTALERVRDYGLKEVEVLVKGVGVGREAAVRALYANGLNLVSIKDVTPAPHNGCRPPRPRRV